MTLRSMVAVGACSSALLPYEQHQVVDLRHTSAPFTTAAPLDRSAPASTAVAVMGAGALGRVIADRCTRPLRVAALARCHPYERLRPEHVGRVVTHERGLFGSVPDATRRILTIVGSADDRRDLEELCRLVEGDVDRLELLDPSSEPEE